MYEGMEIYGKWITVLGGSVVIGAGLLDFFWDLYWRFKLKYRKSIVTSDDDMECPFSDILVLFGFMTLILGLFLWVPGYCNTPYH